MQRLVAPREAANILGISYPTLKQWIYRKKIKTAKTPGGHHGAQTPAMGPDEATLETSWTVVQVAGDVVYRGGGVVMRGPDVVGKPLWPCDGVVEFDESHRPQAVGVFSLDASGTYGFSGTTIANDRRTNTADLITVSAEKGTLKVCVAALLCR